MIIDKIQELKKKVLDEAKLVETMIQLSIDGLLEKDEEKLKKVYDLENSVNEMEIDIEEDCTGIIATNQPEAKNLRTILMILKMNNDLERMGDLSVSIANSAEYLIRKPIFKRLVNIPAMSEATIKMVQDSLAAFMKEDSDLAKQVCINDDIVDDLKDDTYRILITYMLEDPTTIKRAIQINKISSNLERIADLSTNIAEDTVFIAEGKVIKHQTIEG